MDLDKLIWPSLRQSRIVLVMANEDMSCLVHNSETDINFAEKLMPRLLSEWSDIHIV